MKRSRSLSDGFAADEKRRLIHVDRNVENYVCKEKVTRFRAAVLCDLRALIFIPRRAERHVLREVLPVEVVARVLNFATVRTLHFMP